MTEKPWGSSVDHVEHLKAELSTLGAKAAIEAADLEQVNAAEHLFKTLISIMDQSQRSY